MPKQMPAKEQAIEQRRNHSGLRKAQKDVQTLQRSAASARPNIQGHRAMQKVERGWTKESKSSCEQQKEEERAAELQPESYSILQVQEKEDCYHE